MILVENLPIPPHVNFWGPGASGPGEGTDGVGDNDAGHGGGIGGIGTGGSDSSADSDSGHGSAGDVGTGGGDNYYNPYSRTTVAKATWDGPGRDPSSNTYASDTWADITRAQWEDYLNRFVPREDALMNMTTYENPGVVDSTMAIGKQAAAIGYDATQRMNQQAAGRYGAALTQGYQQNQDRRDNVGKSAAIVNEANRIRQELQDRNRQIALGTSNAAVSIREN